MKRAWPLLGLILLLSILVIFLSRPNSHPQHPWFTQFETYPLIIAHADDTGHGLWPGNTLLFLEESANLGVDVLEMDVHMTSDGKIVLMHDEKVDRTTNGSGLIKEKTLAEVSALEVGGNWTQDDGVTFPYEGQGLKPPTLEEVFQRFPDYPMVIEIKQESPSIANQLCDLIRQNGMSDTVLIPSFSDRAMSEFRAACPQVATAPSSSEVRSFVIANFLLATNLLGLEYQAFQVPEESGGIPVVISHFVNSAHNHGIQVHVWTINDPAEMQRFIDMGVDGIMTDRPDLLMDLLNRP